MVDWITGYNRDQAGHVCIAGSEDPEIRILVQDPKITVSRSLNRAQKSRSETTMVARFSTFSFSELNSPKLGSWSQLVLSVLRFFLVLTNCQRIQIVWYRGTNQISLSLGRLLRRRTRAQTRMETSLSIQSIGHCEHLSLAISLFPPPVLKCHSAPSPLLQSPLSLLSTRMDPKRLTKKGRRSSECTLTTRVVTRCV